MTYCTKPLVLLVLKIVICYCNREEICIRTGQAGRQADRHTGRQEWSKEALIYRTGVCERVQMVKWIEEQKYVINID